MGPAEPFAPVDGPLLPPPPVVQAPASTSSDAPRASMRRIRMGLSFCSAPDLSAGCGLATLASRPGTVLSGSGRGRPGRRKKALDAGQRELGQDGQGGHQDDPAEDLADEVVGDPVDEVAPQAPEAEDRPQGGRGDDLYRG